MTIRSPQTKALLAGVVILLVAGGVAAAVLTKRNVSGPLALRQAFVKTSEASPFSMFSTVKMEDIEDASKNLSATIEIQGLSASANTPSSGKASLSGVIPGEISGNISAAFEWRRIDPDTYIKLAPGVEIPDFPFDTELFTNQWIVLSDTDENGGAASLVGGISPIELPECQAPGDLASVFQNVDPSSFLTIRGTSTADIAVEPKESATVYALTVDSVAFDQALQQAFVKANCASTETADSLEGFQNVSVSVGDRTGYIRMISGETQEDDVRVYMTATFGAFGEAPSVEAPTDAVTFEELLNEAFATMFGGEVPSF